MLRVTWRLVMVGLALFLFVPWLSQAEEFRLNSIGIRAGTSGSSVLGRKEREHFEEYDVMANWSLPWGWHSQAGWGVDTRLLGTVGALTAAEETAFVSTLVPGIVFGKKDGWLSLELGGGVGVISEHRFGTQDLGGEFQFAVELAVRAKVYRGIGVGYWFRHMSDAALYGDNTYGFDLHMLEVSYRF